MEKYQGVKFQHKQSKSTFSYDLRLPVLNRWSYLFSQLGLAPVHADGAYGNYSYRTGSGSFIITIAGMIPSEELQPKNYSHVISFDDTSTTFVTEGSNAPSSESFLHNTIYHSLSHVGAILHGHCSLLNFHAANLNIPVTKEFYDYGTEELAASALSLIDVNTRFIILKNHGFVALGKNIDQAGQLTLEYYSKLISLLKILDH